MREALREHAEFEAIKGGMAPEEKTRASQIKIAKAQVVSCRIVRHLTLNMHAGGARTGETCR